MEIKHSLETVYEIWNNQVGSRIEIGPDRDSIGLVSIRSVMSDGKREAEVLCNHDEAKLLHAALGKMLVEMQCKMCQGEGSILGVPCKDCHGDR